MSSVGDLAPATPCPTKRLGRRGWRSVGRIVLRLVITLLVLQTLSFLVVRLIPGDPVRAALGANVSEEFVEQRRQLLGLDGSLLEQYRAYWGHVVRFDFGTSVSSGLPVIDGLRTRFPRTLILVAFALPLTMILAVGAGVASAIRAQRRPATSTRLFGPASATLAMIPDFFYAVALISTFAIHLGWFPAGGAVGPKSYVLPVTAMAIGPGAAIARLVRSRAVAVLASEYLTMARSKRLPARTVYLRHALPNVMIEALTLGGLLVGTMVAGSVVVEVVFNVNGVGSHLVRSITAKDYPVVQASLLILGSIVLVAHALVDVALVRFDPRSADER